MESQRWCSPGERTRLVVTQRRIPSAERAVTWSVRALTGLLVVVALSSLRAQAGDVDADLRARELFDEGTREFALQHYDNALKLFTASHALSDKSQLLYNVALCYDRLGARRQAIAAYERYLAEDTSEERHEEVRARLRELRREGEPPSADVVPGPREAAVRTMVEADEQRARAGAIDDREWRRDWRIWGSVGAVVVGAVVTTVLLTSRQSDAEPLPTATVGEPISVWRRP